jgi:hypothetical protein
MQALALALVACMALYCMASTWDQAPQYAFFRRVLWLLLAIYLLSPVFVFGLALLPILLV